MCAPSAPEPPDPKETAAAQTGTNLATAQANAALGNVNQVTPYGNLTYSQTGNQFIEDANGASYWRGPNGEIQSSAPSSGAGASTTSNQRTTYTSGRGGEVTRYQDVTTPGSSTTPAGWSQVNGYYVPTYTATQTLSPGQQAIFDQSQGAQLNLAKLANNQSAFLNDYLGRPMDMSSIPAGGDAANLGLPSYQQFSNGPDLQTQVGDAGAITRDYGPEDGYSGNVQQVQDALFARMNPQLEQDRAALESRLVNQGLRPGSDAYNRAIDEASRTANDARYGAILAAGQEQSRLAGLDAQRATFQNSAQAQQYSQNANNAAFSNAANQQMFANQNQVTGQNNSLQDQMLNAQLAKFNAQNQQRTQALNEAYTARSQPINEIVSLLSGSQIQQPNFVNTNQPTIPTVDYAGLVNENYNQKLGAWQQQQANSQGLLGGILGLGGKLISLSDDDAKKNRQRHGDVDGEMGLWTFNYKGEPPGTPKHVGLMASEVQKVKPSAVKRGKDGLRRVDYGKALGLMGAG